MSDQVMTSSTNNQRVRCTATSQKHGGWRCQRTAGHVGDHTIKGAGLNAVWSDNAAKVSIAPPAKRSHKKKIVAPPVTPALQMVNHVAMCLDSSGSMEVVKGATINAYNGNLDAIREKSAARKQKTDVSLYTFGHTIANPYSRQSVDTVSKLNFGSYYPSGGTPLLDCVGQAIEDLSKLPDANDPNVSFLVFVTTDGEENASRNYNAAKLKKLMAEKNATDRWSFVFLLPPNHKQTFCQTYGVSDGNVAEWEATTQGVQKAAAATSVGIAQFYNSRSQGIGATRSFFTANLDKVKPEDIKRALKDIQNDVVVLKVEKECDIRDFVISKGYAYTQGNAYYQLTKDEEVQPSKKLLVREKGQKAIYGGDAARSVLGIPSGLVKLKCGNMSNFDVWIQSTSFNRVLCRGSSVVYYR